MYPNQPQAQYAAPYGQPQQQPPPMQYQPQQQYVQQGAYPQQQQQQGMQMQQYPQQGNYANQPQQMQMMQPQQQQQYASQPMQQQPQQQQQMYPMVQQQPMQQQQAPLFQAPPPQQAPSSFASVQPTSPSVVSPVAPLNMESGLKNRSSSQEKEGGGKKEPKLCFCIESDVNLSEEERAKKFKYVIPCSIISGIAAFVLLILAILALVKISEFTSAYFDITNSWQDRPIYNVQFVSTGSSCPTGYELMQETWDGTYDACSCPSAYSANSTDSTSCTSELLTSPYYCHTRTGYPAVSFSIHPLMATCVLRGGISALERSLPDAQGNCPSNTLSCGTTTENAFCEPTNVLVGGVALCPITDIYIGPFASITSYPNVYRTSMGLIEGTLQYLYIARGGAIPDAISPLSSRSASSLPVTNFPIVTLELISGDPCLISGLGSCSYSRSSEYASMQSAARSNDPTRGYTLRSTPSCSGCTTPKYSGTVTPDGKDIRYIRIFSRTEKKVFTDAGVPASFITTNTGYEYTLQIRSEIAWSASCKHPRQSIYDQKTFVAHIRNFQIVLLVVSILTFIIFSCAVPIADVKTRGRWTDDRKAWYCKTFMNVLFKMFVIAFTLATMFISLGVLAYFVAVDGTTESSKCSDALSTEVFKVLADDYRSLSYSNVGSSVAMGASGALDAIGQAIWVCGK